MKLLPQSSTNTLRTFGLIIPLALVLTACGATTTTKPLTQLQAPFNLNKAKSQTVFNLRYEEDGDYWSSGTYLKFEIGQPIEDMAKFRDMIPGTYEIGLLDAQGTLLMRYDFHQPQWDKTANTQFWHSLQENRTTYAIYTRTKNTSVNGDYSFVLCTLTCDQDEGRYDLGGDTVTAPVVAMTAAPQIAADLRPQLKLFYNASEAVSGKDTVRLYSELAEMPAGSYVQIKVGVDLDQGGYPTDVVKLHANSGLANETDIPSHWITENKTVYARIELMDNTEFADANWHYKTLHTPITLVAR